MAQLCYVSVLSLMILWLLFRPIPCECATPEPEFAEDNIACTNKTKDELKDPYESLFTWRFGNSSQGFICNFVGVQCWHNDDGKVMSIKLPGMSLEGGFPEGLKYCGSMTALDLSSNGLSGPIPKVLCEWLPFLVSIDLSSNQFTGSIPHEFRNCPYLNLLRLNDNQLNGSIPWELTQLERLRDINFANNNLSGQIPAKWATKSTAFFTNNDGLCGKPLNKSCGESKSGNSNTAGVCRKHLKCEESTVSFIAGLAAGMVGVCLFGAALWWGFSRLSGHKLAKRKKSIHISDIMESEIFSL